MAGHADAVQMRRFAPSYQALGIVLDFLVSRAPYDRFHAGKLVAALKHQIAHGYHVCAFRGERRLRRTVVPRTIRLRRGGTDRRSRDGRHAASVITPQRQPT